MLVSNRPYAPDFRLIAGLPNAAFSSSGPWSKWSMSRRKTPLNLNDSLFETGIAGRG